jgi:hypothetical protein
MAIIPIQSTVSPAIASTVTSTSPLAQLAQLFQKSGITPTSSASPTSTSQMLNLFGESPPPGTMQQGDAGQLMSQQAGGDDMQNLQYLKAIMGGAQAPGTMGQMLGSYGQTTQGPNLDGSAGSTTGDTGFLGFLGSLFDG